MSRVQLALNVDDLEASIAFYSSLFDTEPAKRKPGYANFAIAQPPLKLVEVADTATVTAETGRLADAGLVTRPESGTCCYAEQDKVWVTGPGQERWEVYTVLADSETFGSAPSTGDAACCTDQEPAAACC